MEKMKNGIYATAMDDYVKEMYEEMEDEETATLFLDDWLQLGVPDGNTLGDNVVDFGEQKDFNELLETFLQLCKDYKLCPNFEKNIQKIMENLQKSLDNPYYFVV
jgi:hypothetical protein